MHLSPFSFTGHSARPAAARLRGTRGKETPMWEVLTDPEVLGVCAEALFIGGFFAWARFSGYGGEPYDRN